mmetsp:Transcript_99919/g.287241  ORF Transcript_99919/g.287241 Transcript_99919/m.287241 type:complete len:107 (-) Transcript_99919:78-398(-)
MLRNVSSPMGPERHLVLLLGDGATQSSGPGGKAGEVGDAAASTIVDTMQFQALHHRAHLLNHVKRDEETPKTRRMVAQEAPVTSSITPSKTGRHSPDVRHRDKLQH